MRFFRLNNAFVKKSVISISMLIFFFFGSVLTHGDDRADFYVTPNLPKNQLADSENYFNVLLAPHTKESLKLTLINAKNEPLTINVTAHTAYTNNNGVVEYGKDADTPDASLNWSIAALLATPGIVKLKANETKTIDITLTMPKELFSGVLAGGIRLQKVKGSEGSEEVSEETDKSQQLSIENEFAYVIGVVARNEQESMSPDLTLLDVFPDQLNYRNVFSATIHNSMPTYVNQLTVEAKIKRKGSNDILYQTKKETMQMAPNSSLDLPISLAGDSFKGGSYVAEISASSGENTWEWTKAFTVKSDEAKAFNQSDVTIDHSLKWWWIIPVVMISLLSIIVLLLVKQRNLNHMTQNN